jgi:hypothetical protein
MAQTDGKRHFEDIGIDGIIIIIIYGKETWWVWIGFIWLWIGNCGVLS